MRIPDNTDGFKICQVDGKTGCDAVPECKWYKGSLDWNCVALDTTIAANADNCKNIVDKSACYNMIDTCMW